VFSRGHSSCLQPLAYEGSRAEILPLSLFVKDEGDPQRIPLNEQVEVMRSDRHKYVILWNTIFVETVYYHCELISNMADQNCANVKGIKIGACIHAVGIRIHAEIRRFHRVWHVAKRVQCREKAISKVGAVGIGQEDNSEIEIGHIVNEGRKTGDCSIMSNAPYEVEVIRTRAVESSLYDEKTISLVAKIK